MHSESVFLNLSILLVIGTMVAMIMRAFKQPLIIGHILTGVIAGPALFHIISDTQGLEAFGKFGIALLLFVVGLGLNPKIIKEVGKASLYTGIGQVVLTTVIGFFVVKLLGYSTVASWYISIALAFSSTIIIIKLLTDKKEHTKLYGKISIGFLLVQDIMATFALLYASATRNGGLSIHELSGLIFRGTLTVAMGLLLTKVIVRPLTGFLAKSQELLFLFAIAWGLGMGVVFGRIGFSMEVGALFAGVLLAGMPYAQDISSRLRPLRDFFIVVFFISLGANIDLSSIGRVLWEGIGLSLFVLIGNPLVVLIIMGMLGYTKKTSFKAGLAVAQVSEFSLIFMSMGLESGKLDKQAVSLVTMVGFITIAFSSYMIIYADKLYLILEKYLSLFERRKVKPERENAAAYDAIIIGYHKGGREFTKTISGITKKFVVIDYDPDVIDELDHKNLPYIYGDVTDPELLEELNFAKTKFVLVTINDHPTNTFLVRSIESANPSAVVICQSDNFAEAEELYELGASYVMMPHFIGSEKISSFIRRNGFKKNEFKKFRSKHLALLKQYEADKVDIIAGL